METLDEIILLDIYPAREEPIEGVDSQMLLAKIRNNNKSISSRSELPEMIKKKRPGILLSMGAGDIDQLVGPIKEKLTEQE